MHNAVFQKTADDSLEFNDDYCTATTDVSDYLSTVESSGFGESNGCVFKVGNDMYFVPTQQVADDDMIYITCDAQKIEGPLDDWRSRLSLGDIAGGNVEDAILEHLTTKPRKNKQGESFVVTRDGKTFRL